MDEPADITLKDVILHLQGMEQRLTKSDTQLAKRIDSVGASLSRQIDRVERNLTGQIDAIDQRLDAVEIEHLPKRMKKLEQVVGIG